MTPYQNAVGAEVARLLDANPPPSEGIALVGLRRHVARHPAEFPLLMQLTMAEIGDTLARYGRCHWVTPEARPSDRQNPAAE